MTKRKDYVTRIDSLSVDRLLELASELHLETETFEGNLLDNHVIYDTERIKFGRVKPRKYIMIKEFYLNEWSSEYEITMTNNENKIKEYVSKMEVYV